MSPSIIGTLVIGKLPRVTLNTAGEWECDNPLMDDIVEHLNKFFSPYEGSTGDCHLPFGVAAMNRAAISIRGRVELAKEIPPLRPGCIS